MTAPSKHPRLRTAVRKTAKWGGAVVTVVLVVVWIGSGWWAALLGVPGGGCIALNRGRFFVMISPGDRNPTVKGSLSVQHIEAPLSWSFAGESHNGRYVVSIPIWCPALFSLGATTFAWRLDSRPRRRARARQCTGCGYDRSVLAAGAACPECGAAASA